MPRDRQERPLADRRVLVAEDDLLTMMLLEDMLRLLGAEVVGSAGSVEDIVRSVETEQGLHAATLDVNLRGQLVYEAAAILRARGVPFVFITAYDELHSCPPDMKRVPFVRKPFRIDELADALARALAGAEAP